MIKSLEGLKDDLPNYIEHKIVAWETKYGEIRFGPKDYETVKEVFKDYFGKGKKFDLATPEVTFLNENFNDEDLKWHNRTVRLSCKPFFMKLKPGDIIYLQPAGQGKITVTRGAPIKKKLEVFIEDLKEDNKVK